jgi:hypothetical protein
MLLWRGHPVVNILFETFKRISKHVREIYVAGRINCLHVPFVVYSIFRLTLSQNSKRLEGVVDE